MRCRVKDCTREEETAWVTDRITDAGHNEQVPVCGVHLVQLASREPVEFGEGLPAAKNPSEWVIKVQLREAGERYYGENWFGGDFARGPGDAHRYESELAARYIGYRLKEDGRIQDFTVEEVVNPRTRH